MQSPTLVVQHREQLAYLLTEAAEVEHNLMCCYLYAAFSLKRGEDEGLTKEELALVERWRRTLVGVAVEEMTHLSLVANLLTAIGASPHFNRPNFPVDPGFYPEGVVIALAPFDLATAEHFAYLERPEGAPLKDGAGFDAKVHYARALTQGGLMPSGQDYATVGDLYRGIELGFEALCERLGEKALFVGDPSAQVGPDQVSLTGLVAVTDLASARVAFDTIVSQGEGAETSREGSHFQRFSAILEEFRAASARRAGFAPARPVARNPVMRSPPRPEGRVHIKEPAAARLVDLGNATYGFMLRLLVQGFGRSDKSLATPLLDAAIDVMFALPPVAEVLTRLPASAAHPGVNAGITFAMSRAGGRLPFGASEGAFLAERARELGRGFAAQGDLSKALPELAGRFVSLAEKLENLFSVLPNTAGHGKETAPMSMSDSKSDSKPTAFPSAAGASSHASSNGASVNATPPPVPLAAAPAAAPNATPPIELAAGKKVAILFEGKRCIHSRHCVLTLPQVFRANVQGPWIAPDAASVEEVVALAHNCPSGAIRYERLDGGPGEEPPPVNVMRVRENGPLSFAGDIHCAGKVETRVTLCRCGASQNKPYCDGSHHAAGFTATGEPPTQDTPALAHRDGALTIKPLANGPLHITGNLEICAGTGRTVSRVTSTALCRCGSSQSKPFCDGSHRKVGFQAAAVEPV